MSWHPRHLDAIYSLHIIFAVASAGQSYLSVRHLLHNSEVYRAYFRFGPLIKCYRRGLSTCLCSTSAERNQISPNNPQKSQICNTFSITPYETYVTRKASGFYPITNYRGDSESEKPNDLFQIRGKALAQGLQFRHCWNPKPAFRGTVTLSQWVFKEHTFSAPEQNSSSGPIRLKICYSTKLFYNFVGNCQGMKGRKVLHDGTGAPHGSSVLVV